MVDGDGCETNRDGGDKEEVDSSSGEKREPEPPERIRRCVCVEFVCLLMSLITISF